MWTKNLALILFLQVVLTQKVVENTENTSIKSNTITTKVDENNKVEKVITQQEITKIHQNNNTVEEHEKLENVQQEINFMSNQQYNADDFDFKYYWILLVGSSLAIVGLIVFKSFRMRRSRAEVRYGKPTASDEIEPLGSNSKWDDDDSSSENEDQIFDINFLKNTRLQKHSDNV